MLLAPAPDASPVVVESAIELQPGRGDSRLTDLQRDHVLVGLHDPSLAAIGLKPSRVDAQRRARGASLAARPEEHVAEPPPALRHPRSILFQRQLGDVLVFEPGHPVRKITAPGDGGEEVIRRLHGLDPADRDQPRGI